MSVTKQMPDNTLMSDSCFLALIKDRGRLNDLLTLIQFLKPWSLCIATYTDKILLCLQQNFPPLTKDFVVRPTKAKCKAILKVARTSKKLKFMDDPLITEQVQAVELKDKWLVERGWAPPKTKAQIKKATDAEKKLANK